MENNFTEYVDLNNSSLFVNCTCSANDKVPYSLRHTPKPIHLTKEMVESIEMVLWYSPNNLSSFQTFENSYLNSFVFEDAIISYFLRYSNLKPEDICFLTSKKIDDNLIEPYSDYICKKCNKIIVTKRSNETKIVCILRHLRNCIAHGRFNLLSNDNFIGYDDLNGNCSGIFKLNIITLYRFCEQLIKYPDFTISNIIQYAFLKAGYSVISMVTGGFNYRDNDISEELVFAISTNHAFRINCSRYLKCSKVENIETIKEYTVDYDEQFNKDVGYIDLYYCENEKNLFMISDNKYVISKNDIESLCSGNFSIIDSIGTA